MKVTEKLYIERLETMIGRYKEDPCSHCPMTEDFDAESDVIVQSGETGIGNAKGCRICRNLTQRYANAKDIKMRFHCPCEHFKNDGMAKVAWKVIRGWKKDHNGGGE